MFRGTINRDGAPLRRGGDAPRRGNNRFRAARGERRLINRGSRIGGSLRDRGINLRVDAINFLRGISRERGLLGSLAVSRGAPLARDVCAVSAGWQCQCFTRVAEDLWNIVGWTSVFEIVS